MEKTVYEKRLMVETISVLPRTLEIETQQIKVGAGAVNADMFVVNGKDPADRKVWVATFVDADEAQVFVQSSRTFGRPVLGAVMAGQEKVEGEAQKGGEMSDDATAVAVGNEEGTGSPGKPS